MAKAYIGRKLAAEFDSDNEAIHWAEHVLKQAVKNEGKTKANGAIDYNDEYDFIRLYLSDNKHVLDCCNIVNGKLKLNLCD